MYKIKNLSYGNPIFLAFNIIIRSKERFVNKYTKVSCKNHISISVFLRKPPCINKFLVLFSYKNICEKQYSMI